MAHRPKFPFRIVNSWTHPSEISMCEGCQTPRPTYATDNYIDMQRMIGKDMYVTLANDPWVRAIKAQAREQYGVSLTSHLCVSCLNETHIATFGNSPSWQEALALLASKYGEVAVATFLLVNSYEDEGASVWFLCPVTDTILDVVDLVEQVEVPEHATRHTTLEDRRGVVEGVTQFAQRHGKTIKVIHQDE